MSWRICIPTYQRPELLQRQTLAYLERSDIDPSVVTLLVADAEQRFLYDCALPEEWGDRLEETARGLSASRNYAREHLLEEGERVLWIDDDVKSIKMRLNDKRAEEVSVEEVAEAGFAAAEQVGAYLWSVYPTLNPFYMKPKVRTGLWHCVGCFYGEIARKDASLNLEYGDAKEDYERTLRHYEKDGATVRLDWYAVDTTYYRESGGIEGRTPETVAQTVRSLQNRWPGLVRPNPRRKSGYPEILLKA